MTAAKERWLFPWQVAELFRVNNRTVSRWADEGRLPNIRTLGGNRKFPESQILEIRDRTLHPVTQPWNAGEAP
jgi:excisionase family DNA binding protein